MVLETITNSVFFLYETKSGIELLYTAIAFF